MARLRPKDYIGCICVTRFPYYDSVGQKVAYKSRPALVIGCEFEQFPCDMVILPISKISDVTKKNRDFDYELNHQDCMKLGLKCSSSYVRTHKQSVVYSYDVGNVISDLKNDYKAIYDEVKKTHYRAIDELF